MTTDDRDDQPAHGDHEDLVDDISNAVDENGVDPENPRLDGHYPRSSATNDTTFPSNLSKLSLLDPPVMARKGRTGCSPIPQRNKT